MQWNCWRSWKKHRRRCGELGDEGEPVAGFACYPLYLPWVLRRDRKNNLPRRHRDTENSPGSEPSLSGGTKAPVLPSFFAIRHTINRYTGALYIHMKLRHQNSSSARATVCALVVLSLSVLFARAYAPASAYAPAKDVHGIAVANIDRSVQPGDDFYHYANGEWIKKTVIPPDRAGVGVFTALADLTNKRTAAIIEEAAKAKAPAGSDSRKIRSEE